MKRLFRDYCKPYTGVFLASALCILLSSVFSMLVPQTMRFAIDSVLDGKASFLDSLKGTFSNIQLLTLLALAAVVFALLNMVFSFLFKYLVSLGSEGVIKDMRDGLYRHIAALPYSYFGRIETGELVQKCTLDVDVVKGFLIRQLPEVLRTAAVIVTSVSFIFYTNVLCGVISVIFIPVIALYSGVFFKKLSVRFQKADEAEGILSGRVLENLSAFRVVRAFGKEREEVRRFDEKNEEYCNIWVKIGRLLGAYWGVGDFFAALQILAVMLAGIYGALNGTLSSGGFVAILTYSGMLIWPVRSFGRTLSEFSKCTISLKRIQDVMDEPQEQDTGTLTPDMTGDIVFNEIRFAFPGGEPLFDGLTFTVKGGTTLGILGGVGSGKSTLGALLLRLYPLKDGEGTITVSGTDIRDIRLAHLRGQIGYTTGEPFLYSKSISENISIAARSASMTEIREAAQDADIARAVENFQKGYDTLVGERGVTLSGGQRQRVAIARTFLRGTPIMVFDDALSAVDSETDKRIRENLARRTKETTTILISHRISTLMDADAILVLKDGKMEQYGSHAQLMREDGTYRRIALEQGVDA